MISYAKTLRAAALLKNARQLTIQQSRHLISPNSPNTEDEVQHHANQAKDWWNVNGSMSALHAFNEIRVPFIREGLIARGNVENSLRKTTNVLKRQKILEVGCGGGLLTERLARLGATVTGIDLGNDVIQAAIEHLNSESSDIKDRITYKVEPIESHAQKHQEEYDAVVVSEVIEHITDKPQFLTHCIAALKPDGSLFITTPNRTLPMWIGGILISENLLNIVPKGTHHWDKLIRPIELERILDALNCQTVLINGSTYDFWSNTWKWVNCTTMCYALQAIKIENNNEENT